MLIRAKPCIVAKFSAIQAVYVPLLAVTLIIQEAGANQRFVSSFIILILAGHDKCCGQGGSGLGVKGSRVKAQSLSQKGIRIRKETNEEVDTSEWDEHCWTSTTGLTLGESGGNNHEVYNKHSAL